MLYKDFVELTQNLRDSTEEGDPKALNLKWENLCLIQLRKFISAHPKFEVNTVLNQKVEDFYTLKHHLFRSFPYSRKFPKIIYRDGVFYNENKHNQFGQAFLKFTDLCEDLSDGDFIRHLCRKRAK